MLLNSIETITTHADVKHRVVLLLRKNITIIVTAIHFTTKKSMTTE